MQDKYSSHRLARCPYPEIENLMGRIVEVSSEGYSLRINRGFLVLSIKGGTTPERKVPLDEIESLVVNTSAASLTSGVLTSLAQRGTPVVFCDTRHLPIATSLPLSDNYEHSKRLREQARLTQSQADRIWAQIVKSKIHRQSEVLAQSGKSDINLRHIADKVLDGDPGNCEAEAAKVYWKSLFGDGFRRSADDVINARLNYGYAVLRATLARFVCAHGLSPSLGIHHRNAANSMCLIDDLMEPFRPLIDWEVSKMERVAEALTKDEKVRLVGLIKLKVRSDTGLVVFESLLKASVLSFYRVCSESSTTLEIEWHLLDV